MDENSLRAVLGAAVRTATEQTRRDFQTTIDELTARLTLIERPVQVEEYREIAIDPTVRCDESLDVVKSLPEFNGDHSRYVSWRQAAHTAYKILKVRRAARNIIRQWLLLETKLSDQRIRHCRHSIQSLISKQ